MKECERRSEASKHTKKERDRRSEERTLFEELSRYYELEGGKDKERNKYGITWERPSLMKESKLGCVLLMRTIHLPAFPSVLEDLKFRYPPPGLSTDSAS